MLDESPARVPVWRLWIFTGAMVMFLFAVAGTNQAVMAILDRLIPVRPLSAAEYHPVEQFSKFMLMLALLVSVMVYRHTADRARARLALGTILFATVLYFAESNFINTSVQMVIGPAMVLVIGWWMWRVCRGAALLCLLGFIVVAISGFGDVWHDHADLLPTFASLQWVGSLGYRFEEQLDLFGVSAFFFAVAWSFRETVNRLLTAHLGATLLLMLSALLVSVGNGYAHFQHHPQMLHLIGATCLAMSGLAELLAVSHLMLPDTLRPGFFGRRGGFTIFLLISFGLLPVVYHDLPKEVNGPLWVVVISLCGLLLWRTNPLLSAGHVADTSIVAAHPAGRVA